MRVRRLTSRDNLFTIVNDNAGNASRRSETSLAKRRESAFFILCAWFRKPIRLGQAETHTPGLRDSFSRERISFKACHRPGIVPHPQHHSIAEPRKYLDARRLVAQVRAAHAPAQVTIMFFREREIASVRRLQRDCSMTCQRPAAHGLVVGVNSTECKYE